MSWIICGLLVGALVYAIRLLTEQKSKHDKLVTEFSPIIQLDEEVLRFRRQYSSLKSDYANARSSLKFAEHKISLFYIGAGTVDDTPYIRQFSADQKSDVEERLAGVKQQIKDMVREKTACRAPSNWTVNDSKAEGRKMINREVKLRLRCVDNAAKAALSLVDWNNINRLKERLELTFEDVNTSGKAVEVQVSRQYLKLRTKELELKFELDEVKREIKEEEREERRIQREAEREEKKIAEAARKAEEERIFYDEFVSKELERLRGLEGSDHQHLEQKIASYQEELQKLKERAERAQSLAQQTRAGYVYVISNQGSFGKEMCKIGMTRRAEPMDRVKELGDASVPHQFDVASLVYTEDAPALERYLHNQFADHRVNLINKRKEFFFVDPAEVAKAIESSEINVEQADIDAVN